MCGDAWFLLLSNVNGCLRNLNRCHRTASDEQFNQYVLHRRDGRARHYNVRLLSWICEIESLLQQVKRQIATVLEAERDSQKTFQPLPFHFVEISRLLFDHARDDIADIYMVRSLIEDIKDVRFQKIGTGLEVISQRTAALKLEHLTAMEVNIVRPFVVRALQTFYKLDSPEIIQELDLRANRQFPTANHGPKRPLKR
ncbi:hypothetical protein ACSBR1_027118 [Camellia fascicularis]